MGNSNSSWGEKKKGRKRGAEVKGVTLEDKKTPQKAAGEKVSWV